MPELPEVETIKNGLLKEVLGEKIVDVVALWPGIIKNLSFNDFKKEVLGRKIVDIKRRAKNLLVFLDNQKILVFHFKLTGHALVVPSNFQVDSSGKWVSKNLPPALKDPQNQFIRIIFFLSSDKQLAISDLRKFAYIKLFNPQELNDFLKEYGPEPLEKDFTFEVFKERIGKIKSPIKKALMDQKVIAGVGNIYSDEALFEAGIHPLLPANQISEKQLQALYRALQEVLKRGLERGGTSISDFRNIEGQRGTYDLVRKVYRREGQKCFRCGAKITRIKIGGRSAYFCPQCQKLPKN